MKVVTRSEWNARPPTKITTLPWSQIDTIFVHYTAAESDQTGDPKAKMLGIQRYHMVTKGWNDIAYNFGFARGGVILEGRGWQIKSAATGIENSHSVAFVFLGADKVGRDDVTAAGREALGQLIREGMRQKGKQLIVKGHTQASGTAGLTACPGPELLSYIASRGWQQVVPPVAYPRHFYLFAAWYLGEGPVFKQHGPHKLSVRPTQLPARFSPQMATYRAALRYYLSKRVAV